MNRHTEKFLTSFQTYKLASILDIIAKQAQKQINNQSSTLIPKQYENWLSYLLRVPTWSFDYSAFIVKSEHLRRLHTELRDKLYKCGNSVEF